MRLIEIATSKYACACEVNQRGVAKCAACVIVCLLDEKGTNCLKSVKIEPSHNVFD